MNQVIILKLTSYIPPIVPFCKLSVVGVQSGVNSQKLICLCKFLFIMATLKIQDSCQQIPAFLLIMENLPTDYNVLG